MIVEVPRALWEAGELLAVDRLVHAAEDRGPVELAAPHHPEEVALRYQRLAPRTNRASATPEFTALRACHRSLHPLHKPLVRADWDHAVDTWQWALRLDPEASAEVQLAALLHDVERLESEADDRVEHRARDYQRFKDAHARRGAQIARELLAGGPWGVERVVALIARHEQAGDDPDRQLLADADVLSFFALNSPGYLAWYGPAQTEVKVAFSLGRASPRVRPWLERVRLPPLVREMTSR